MASAFTTELIEDLHKSENNTSQRIRRWRREYLLLTKVNEGIIDTSVFFLLLLYLARGSVQIYVLCDKKMNTKEQQHTHQHLVKADITMRFKESAKRALSQFDVI